MGIKSALEVQMKKILFLPVIVSVLFMTAAPVWSAQTVPFPDLLNPSKISVGDKYLYVLQEAAIFVYGLDDFKLKKKFGKIGEGPGEFTVGRRFSARSLYLIPSSDNLMVSCRNKVLVFSGLGDFISEKKMLSGRTSRIYPMGDAFVAESFSGFRTSKPARVIVLYDSGLKKTRDLYTQPIDPSRRGFWRNPSAKYNEFSSSFGMAVGSDRVYVYGSNRFEIEAISADGKKEAPISVDYEPVKITASIREGLLDYYKNYRFKGRWDQMKNRLEIPPAYPAIQRMLIADGRLFVQTFRMGEGASEFYTFKHNNSLDKVLILPLVRMNEREFYPFCIHNGKLYQMVEDEDEEEWILHVHGLSDYYPGGENEIKPIQLKQ